MPPASLECDLPGDETVVSAAREILERLLAGYDGPVGVRLWNGERIFAGADAPCTVAVHHPSVLRHLVLHQDLVRLAEFYYFDEGSTNVYQVLAAPAYQPLATPLRRDDLYQQEDRTGNIRASAQGD